MYHLDDLTLRQKIAQLMIVGFQEQEVTQELHGLLADDMVGGVILFPRNLGRPEHVRSLTTSLQESAKAGGQPFPLMIAVDQENGIVRKLTDGFTLFPGNMLLGAVNDVSATEDISAASAEELRAVGITMNLAPNVDVNNNPDNPVIGVRSFGESPQRVAEQGAAFIKGHHRKGVMTTAKHFPGHGDTSVDSHLALPVIDYSLEQLQRVALPPFVQAAASGVDSIMMSHIYFPVLDADEKRPASLSYNVTTGLLRESLGYTGPIMTDCLEMEGVSTCYGTAQGALEALKAGADLLLVSHTYEAQLETLDVIEQAVKRGDISETRIHESLKRVYRLKRQNYTWSDDESQNPEADVVDVAKADHQLLANHQYDHGVTLVKGEEHLPLNINRHDKVLVVTVTQKSHAPVTGKMQTADDLAYVCRDYGAQVVARDIAVSPSDEVIHDIAYVTRAYDWVIIGSDQALRYPQQAKLIREVYKNQAQTIVIAVGDPYDLRAFPQVPMYLATYEYTRSALEAAVGIIYGYITPEGTLPVKIEKEESYIYKNKS